MYGVKVEKLVIAFAFDLGSHASRLVCPVLEVQCFYLQSVFITKTFQETAIAGWQYI